jgi:hypothetical protein
LSVIDPEIIYLLTDFDVIRIFGCGKPVWPKGGIWTPRVSQRWQRWSVRAESGWRNEPVPLPPSRCRARGVSHLIHTSKDGPCHSDKKQSPDNHIRRLSMYGHSEICRSSQVFKSLLRPLIALFRRLPHMVLSLWVIHLDSETTEQADPSLNCAPWCPCSAAFLEYSTGLLCFGAHCFHPALILRRDVVLSGGSFELR